jgi:hypothetical protein
MLDSIPLSLVMSPALVGNLSKVTFVVGGAVFNKAAFANNFSEKV